MPASADRSPPLLAQPVAGWGGASRLSVVRQSEDLAHITEDVPLTRGLGRSYGDASLPPPSRADVASSLLADRLIHFDAETGVLRAESGFSLRDLYLTFLPRGWFTPVTPGTQFVTLGGMVASDVHGKNHHVAGTIGRHLRALRLRVAGGDIVECSPTVEADLFWATIGGMGLTGHILEVEMALVRVPAPWIVGESWRVPNIDVFMADLRQAASEWPFTMGWIDCLSGGNSLGRGVMYVGRWATPGEAPSEPPPPRRRLGVPFPCPRWMSGRLMARTFNEAIYQLGPRRRRRRVIHPEAFFYPLDSIRHWNRLYGRQGFTQHQSVLPESAGPAAVRQLLELLSGLGGASFLSVIKDCGDQGDGVLSFPMRGVSVALDLPIRDNTQAIVDRLNEYVISVGGRIYLTKDALTLPEHFRQMEPRLDRFLDVRRRWDPAGAIRSAQSVRLFGDQP